MDFVKNLDTDMSLAILSCLDDPSDLVRASAVSRSWRAFVIKYSLSKNLCLKLFHQLTSVDRIIDTSNDMKESFEASGSSSSLTDDDDDTRVLEREHRVYALLTKGCTSSPIRSCIADAIVASSTDNFPAESILNTLDERDRIGGTPSYWSSTGHHRTSVPETLLYQLKGDLCVVTELSVQPFQAYFQPGTPIYSSHYVRFRLGHLDNNQAESGGKIPVENKYVWTYTSQEFPMAQENRLQNFKLPEPVLCIGGYMLVEFLGRVQTQEMDGLYYICVSHVKVMGRSLAKSFQVVDPDESGKFGLKVLSYSDPQEMDENEEEAEGQGPFRPMRNLEQLLNFLHRHPLDVEYVWPESDDDEDAAESDGEV
ncbi:F-box protein [Raphanus sativus]|uniref:F-box protein At4g00755 n=1 Tax=Raphanus sativus TaxID=3726 RepID=A0A9W3CV18_RAPSA|nr:F-box protein At4g00755 [Raphanus sativus]XP_056855308.1 F-box protein At4g00755 [Raphanus sativus]XP_056855314.1 F-box protein At4g00755 [Raphanus sativus]KAJ4910283.1 F-box protein [Raphanus sativus]